jgi:uncharacterized NAD(P)/FAD-binding protein YdhS
MFMEMQSNQSYLDECYDIAIVGSGISCAYTLINYISLLEQRSPLKTVKVAVLEKSGEFWAGLPYGSRSGRNTLVISSLKEFIPQELERSQFVSWLSQNRHWIFDIPEYKDGKLSSKWLEINEVHMAQGLWDELFLPRFTFGLYLQHRLTQLIESATTKGILQVSLLASEVIDIQPVSSLYKVDMAIASGHESLLAKKIILTIGSPSDKVINYFPELENDICLVNNLYEPSQGFNIRRICEFLERPENQAHGQILILGANASALEVIYCLSDSQRASGLISKFIVLSPSDAFPYRISHEVRQPPYSPRYLTSLIESKSFTARKILDVMKSEIDWAKSQNINIADIYHDLSKAMIDALNQLSFAEQEKFVSKYGEEIGKLQRRAGTEYLDVVDALAAQGKLEFLKGKFIRYFPSSAGELECEYIDGEGEKQVLVAPIRLIISCIGFPYLSNSSSGLIQNLIRRGVLSLNNSGRGFAINNRNFEASKNCYIMGPLVAGNIMGDLKIWHAESCARVINLAKELAEVLVQDQDNRT